MIYRLYTIDYDTFNEITLCYCSNKKLVNEWIDKNIDNYDLDFSDIGIEEIEVHNGN